MSEASLKIGGRNYRVACVDGQEESLELAAKELDQYALSVLEHNSDLQESQLLLMSALMISDQLLVSSKENQSLQSHQRDLESRLSKVETQAKSANEGSLKEAKLSLEAAQTELRALREKFEKSKSDSEDQDTIKRELTEAREALAQSRNMFEAEKERNTALLAELDEAKNEAQTLAAGAAATTSNDEMSKEMEALRAENLRLEIQMTKLTQGLEALHIDDSGRAAEHAKAIDEHKATNEKLKAELDQLKEELESANKQLASQEAELAQANTTKSQAENQVKVPENTAATKDDLMSDLINGLERLAGE